MNKLKFIALTVVALFCLGNAASAQMSWDKKFSKKNIDFIIVTGNYVESKLLAECSQKLTRQPIILVDINKGTNRAFLIGPDGKALVISDSDFTNFINFAHPKGVVFLGDSSFTPSRYKQMVNTSIKTYEVKHKSWENNAWQLQAILGARGLAKMYLPLVKDIRNATL